MSLRNVAIRHLLLVYSGQLDANQSVSKTFRYVLELKGTIFKLFNFLLQRYSALIASLILPSWLQLPEITVESNFLEITRQVDGPRPGNENNLLSLGNYPDIRDMWCWHTWKKKWETFSTFMRENKWSRESAEFCCVLQHYIWESSKKWAPNPMAWTVGHCWFQVA